MSDFQYRFEGDCAQIFRGRILKPGDLIESAEQLIHGHFKPLSPEALAAHAEYEAKYLAPAQEVPEVSPAPLPGTLGQVIEDDAIVLAAKPSFLLGGE